MAISARLIGNLGGGGGIPVWAGDVEDQSVPQWTADPIPVPATTAGAPLPAGRYRVHVFCRSNSAIAVVHFLGVQAASGFSQFGHTTAEITLSEETTPEIQATNNGQGGRTIQWAVCLAFPID